MRIKLLSVVGLLLLLSASALSGFGAAEVHAESAGTYIVQPGDTLLGIAGRYGVSVSQLARANGLRWNSWVYVGQRLVIPGVTSSPPVSSGIYVVRRGDTLSAIAMRYHTTVYQLAQMNGLRNPNRIYVGQRLVVPGGPVDNPSGNSLVYRVQRGDTLLGIAMRFRVSMWDIVLANNIVNPSLIYVGQRLVIPTRYPVPGTPTVTISPTSGPSGTLVTVVASGFPFNTPVSVGMGPQNSEFSEVARGTTNGNGVFSVQVPVQGAPGMALVFAVAADGQPGVTSPNLFHITS